MTLEEKSILLDTINSVAQYYDENQYDTGPKSINEKGIAILKTVIIGLYNESEED